MSKLWSQNFARQKMNYIEFRQVFSWLEENCEIDQEESRISFFVHGDDPGKANI